MLGTLLRGDDLLDVVGEEHEADAVVVLDCAEGEDGAHFGDEVALDRTAGAKLLRTARLTNLSGAQQEGKQVDRADDEYPHEVNEVPVHLTRLDSKMILRREVTAQGTDQTDE